ncbi:MAG TPA: fatty acid desaturase [Quisquiliibacterium sp.]|nr:fatty acid desaturase [Quisquiliibacterium sp.]HQD82257.1 fatty acid desaturase [Quisquiliibacterium sp.]HQN12913.1 fatty acid desaturase [Quisquiliibacterium sp.]HQP66293.1 fatty acid desaturase [Quisquiliibacterium sp.]
MLDSILSFLNTGLADFSAWQIVAYTLITTHITIAGVTIYLHRCQAHRALDLHPIMSHFFRFWLWLTTGMVTREWAAIHRKHHARCETPDDPHSPQTRGLRKVLLEGAELYREEARNRETIEKFGHGTPDDWIEHALYSRYTALGVYLTLVIDVLLFGVIGLTVFAVQMLWIPIFAAGVINGLGHFWGYRNWDCPDASTNIFPWGILIGGEELHNNHHSYASSAKLSSKWYEFDIGWMYIRLMSMVGLATVRRVAPTPKFAAAKPVADLDTLQAVIQNRYDVMAAFASSLRRACVEEARRLSSSNNPNGRLLVSARRWLAVDATKWTEQHRAKLGEIFAASDRVRKLVEMRAELSAVWERSNLSREQLLALLQQWCARAEASGVRALQDIALRMRCYAG